MLPSAMRVPHLFSRSTRSSCCSAPPSSGCLARSAPSSRSSSPSQALLARLTRHATRSESAAHHTTSPVKLKFTVITPPPAHHRQSPQHLSSPSAHITISSPSARHRQHITAHAMCAAPMFAFFLLMGWGQLQKNELTAELKEENMNCRTQCLPMSSEFFQNQNGNQCWCYNDVNTLVKPQ